MAKVTSSAYGIRVEYSGSSSLINERTWHAPDVHQALCTIFGIKPNEKLLAVEITASGLRGEIGHR